MSDASDISDLLGKAAAELRAAKRGAAWKTLLVGAVTFVASLLGSAFAAGRYFEHASALVEAHERRILLLEGHDELRRNRLEETWGVAIEARRTADIQCHRLDARWNERACP